jgi:hypothetical protein
MLRISRDYTSSITPARTVMGILRDNELLLLETVQGKRVLRSFQLLTDVSDTDRLLKYPWDTGLDSAWVMPATTLSRSATCSWLEQASSRWVVRVHPDPHARANQADLCPTLARGGKAVGSASPGTRLSRVRRVGLGTHRRAQSARHSQLPASGTEQVGDRPT